MLTASIASGIAKALATQLLEQVGVPAGARKLLQVPIDQLLSRSEHKAASVSIERVATAVAGELMAIPRPLQDNPGAAQAAADTFLAVLEAANLSPAKLVELNLDPRLLQSHLAAVAIPHVEGASAERRGHVERAITCFSSALIAQAPNLPGVQLAFMQALLRGRGSEA